MARHATLVSSGKPAGLPGLSVGRGLPDIASAGDPSGSSCLGAIRVRQVAVVDIQARHGGLRAAVHRRMLVLGTFSRALDQEQRGAEERA